MSNEKTITFTVRDDDDDAEFIVMRSNGEWIVSHGAFRLDSIFHNNVRGGSKNPTMTLEEVFTYYRVHGDLFGLERQNMHGTLWYPQAKGSDNISLSAQYRKTPKVTRRLVVDVPIGETTAPEYNTAYYWPNVGSTRKYTKTTWIGDNEDLIRLKTGTVFLNEQDCVAYTKAIEGAFL
jgi:hypothetical protein